MGKNFVPGTKIFFGFFGSFFIQSFPGPVLFNVRIASRTAVVWPILRSRCRSIALLSSRNVEPSHSSARSCSIVIDVTPSVLLFLVSHLHIPSTPQFLGSFAFCNFVSRSLTFLSSGLSSFFFSTSFVFGTFFSSFKAAAAISRIFASFSLPTRTFWVYQSFNSSKKINSLRFLSMLANKFTTTEFKSKCSYSFAKCFFISFKDIFPSKSESIISNCLWIAMTGFSPHDRTYS
mmetsp:Transcript_1985/g.2821  ORF Transcript_1985/g.2821 Transcript_1985/m.2821 type:complete len:233 (+) Transcript_1985:2068-2766(+)